MIRNFKIIPLRLKTPTPSGPEAAPPNPTAEKNVQAVSNIPPAIDDDVETASDTPERVAAPTIWCVSDPYTYQYLYHKLGSWGWSVTANHPEAISEEDRFLDPEESYLEDLAIATVNRLKADPDPLLLIHSALTIGNRSAGHGLLLANRIWSQLAIPTIVCAVDLNVARREASRQARYSTGQAVLPLLEKGKGVETCQNGCLVLWDLLSDKEDFEAAAASARESVKALKSGGQMGRLQLELRGELISEQTKNYRHDLLGLMASLRILEGAYRLGWISHDELKHVFAVLESRNAGDPKRLSLIKRLRDLSVKFPQTHFERAKISHQGVNVWVCDDGWAEAGWDLLLEPLFRNKFGFGVKGFVSLTALRQELMRGPVQATALLLDVHYIENDEIKEQVTAEFLRTLKRDHPLLDVILFTSELKDGLLVREVYELGYRIFFKEIVESSRDPRTYAHKFARTVERATNSMPIRALWELADSGAGTAPSAGIVMDTLKEKLKVWQYHPEPWMVFGLTPLLEQAIREVFAKTFPGIPLPKKHKRNGAGAVPSELDNLWGAVEQIIDQDGSSPASMLCKRLKEVARFSRNSLVHDAPLVLTSDSVLPSIGFALPIVVVTLSLYEIRSSNTFGTGIWENKIEAHIRKLMDALVLSNWIVKNDVRTLLLELLTASTQSQLKACVNKIFNLVNQNSHAFGAEYEVFRDKVSDVKYGIPSFPPYKLRVNQLLVTLSAICLLDG